MLLLFGSAASVPPGCWRVRLKVDPEVVVVAICGCCPRFESMLLLFGSAASVPPGCWRVRLKVDPEVLVAANILSCRGSEMVDG